MIVKVQTKRFRIIWVSPSLTKGSWYNKYIGDGAVYHDFYNPFIGSIELTLYRKQF